MSEFYPGSKQKVRTFETPSEPRSEATFKEFMRKPRLGTIKGNEIKFYTIGELADALNRKPVTIRKWEADGFIPKATFIAPSGDKRGKRRLYTEAQILGLVQIAREEGVLEPNARGSWKPVTETNFRARAIELFTRLAKEISENN